MNRNDIVDLLEKYANQLGWRFSYGNKANQNLLQSNMNENEIYFLLDPVTRKREHSEFGGIGNSSFTGQFLLVVKSTIDQVYHNQTNEDTFYNRVNSLEGGENVENTCVEPSQKLGKYTQNIKPLLDEELPKIENLLDCSDYQITNWSIIDTTDVFDANTDGIIVTFGLKVLC